MNLRFLLVSLSATSAILSVPTGAHAETTPADQLKIWTSNMFDMGANWRQLANHMSQHQFKPDLISLQGIDEGMTDDLVGYLETKVNAGYDFRHGKTADIGSNSAVSGEQPGFI
jgi:hypothetical protein